MRRLRAVAVILVAALSGALIGWPTEAAVMRAPLQPRIVVMPQADGSLAVQARSYTALIGVDGNLHSLRVGDTEMLDDRVAISLGCFFYADGPRRLDRIERLGQTAIRATDGAYSVRYRFGFDEIRATLENAGAKPAPYFVVLSPAPTIATRPGAIEAAAVPANERWGAVRFTAANGAFVELSGGTRIWGPWLDRQVWEVTQVPAGGRQEIRIIAGLGAPPRPALEQLIGVRADVLPESGVVDAGKPIELIVSLDNRSTQGIQGTLSVELSACRGDMVIFTTAAVDAPPQRVTEQTFRWHVSGPDFYGIRVAAVSNGRELGAARASAGYRTDEIIPQVQRPADFGEFWRQTVAGLGTQPPQYVMTRDERFSRAGLEVWLVQYQSLAGKTISGWYVAPEDAHRLPAILYLSGYGARPIEPPVGLAQHGWVVLAIDIRGNRVDRVRPKPFEDYCTEGIESPQTYVYREIVGHALRGLSFLRAREEVDPGRTAVVGVSEGGGVGLLAAALSPSVAAVAADAPMLVDFPLSLRVGSWPYAEITRYVNQRPEASADILRTLSYFDVVNSAPQIGCPVLLNIGLLDRVSLPAAVFGLYNVLPGPKEMHTFPQAGHEGGGEDHWAYTVDWLSRTLGPKSKASGTG